jgi:hypothetical protein
LLDRTLICTPLTRAVEQVVLVGDQNAFEAAVIPPPRSHERQVGFAVYPVLQSAVHDASHRRLSYAGPSRYTGQVSAPDRWWR